MFEHGFTLSYRAIKKLSVVGLTTLTILAAQMSGISFLNATEVDDSKRYYTVNGQPEFFVGYYDLTTYSELIDEVDEPISYLEMIAISKKRANYIRMTVEYGFVPSVNAYALIKGKIDLNNWDQPYWDAVRNEVIRAQKAGYIVHLTFFNSSTLDSSYWNPDNQTRSFYNYSGGFFNTNAFKSNTGIGFYQRRFIDKILAETSNFSNVFYEVGNESYNAPKEWEEAVITYVKSKTSRAITQNGSSVANNTDGISLHTGDTPAQVKDVVASNVGRGFPVWIDPDCYDLCRGTGNDLRRAAWYSFVGGAAGWGGFSFNFPNYESVGGLPKEIPLLLDYYNKLRRFITVSGVRFWEMTPQHELVSNNEENSVLANLGKEYVVYVLDDNTINLDLSATKSDVMVTLYNPRNGVFDAAKIVSGGGTQTFIKPKGANDWAIYLKPQN